MPNHNMGQRIHYKPLSEINELHIKLVPFSLLIYTYTVRLALQSWLLPVRLCATMHAEKANTANNMYPTSENKCTKIIKMSVYTQQRGPCC